MSFTKKNKNLKNLRVRCHVGVKFRLLLSTDNETIMTGKEVICYVEASGNNSLVIVRIFNEWHLTRIRFQT